MTHLRHALPTMEDEWGSPEEVPAFEAAIGLPTPKGDAPTVSKRALTRVSKEMAEEKAKS